MINEVLAVKRGIAARSTPHTATDKVGVVPISTVSEPPPGVAERLT